MPETTIVFLWCCYTTLMTTLPSKTATVIYVRGIPGSGKSYLAQVLWQTFPHEYSLMLDPDAIDFESTAYKNHVQNQIKEGVDEALWPYRFLRAQAYQGIEDGKTIIWNQPFTNLEIFHKAANRLKDHAETHNVRLHILVVELEADPKVAWQRTVERKAQGGHGPSEERFQQFVSDYVSFAGQGYPTVAIDGMGNVTEEVAKVQAALRDFN